MEIVKTIIAKRSTQKYIITCNTMVSVIEMIVNLYIRKIQIENKERVQNIRITPQITTVIITTIIIITIKTGITMIFSDTIQTNGIWENK